MRKSWPQVPLDTVLKQYQEYIDAPEPKVYPKVSVKLYGKGVVPDTPADGASLRMKRHQIAKAGQVILSEIWGKRGAIGLVPPEGDGALCTSHFFLFDVQRDKIDPRYLKTIFAANYLQDQLEALAKGTTGYAAVRPNHLLSCSIPLPLLEEQRRIVARLEILVAKVEEARALRQQTAQGDKALFDAIRRALIGGTPRPEWLPLGSFVEAIENGRSPVCAAHPANTSEWGILKVGAVSFGVFNERQNKALLPDQSFDPSYEVKPGDFLMSRANTTDLVGACVIVRHTRPRLLLSDKTFRFHFRPGVKLIPAWLEHVMKSPSLRDQIATTATGTSPTMKNISKGKVLSLLVPRHTEPEQRQIVAKLDALQAKAEALKHLQSETAVELDGLLPSILDRVLNGEL